MLPCDIDEILRGDLRDVVYVCLIIKKKKMDNEHERILIVIVWNNKRHCPVSILCKASCLTVL